MECGQDAGLMDGQMQQRCSDHRPAVQIVTRPGAMKAPEILNHRPPDPAAGKGGGSGSQTAAKKKSQLAVPTPGPPFARCRFMDEDWRLCESEVSPHLTESSDFAVVCAVGCAGAGRSTVLSLLLSPFLVGTEARSGMSQSSFKVPLGIRTAEAFLAGNPSPMGVDMCISTADRLLLLDAQPLFETVTAMPESDLKSELYLMIFLASICHTLLVVTDTVMEVHLWKFLRHMAMLKSKVPNLATFVRQKQAQASAEPVQPIQEDLPRLLVVFNNLILQIDDGVEMPELYEPVQNFLGHCEWKAAPSVDCTALPQLPGKSCQELLCSEKAAAAGLRLRQHLFSEGHPRGRFGPDGLQLTEKQWPEPLQRDLQGYRGQRL
ncbi:Protein SMG9 [Symbiodinium microadriaticum]|uniref:Protein SMG9 n=1 Tax=Symbiodinium microadriaticum TaxID=2951 RepID=A0A1Q9E3K9_SYMMI|nr:Protein SMG9 [Symbiodinium microadriaticum]